MVSMVTWLKRLRTLMDSPKNAFRFRAQAQHKGVKIEASRTKRRMVRTSLGWFIAGGSDAIVCSELGFQVERHDVIKLDS